MKLMHLQKAVLACYLLGIYLEALPSWALCQRALNLQVLGSHAAQDAAPQSCSILAGASIITCRMWNLRYGCLAIYHECRLQRFLKSAWGQP